MNELSLFTGAGGGILGTRLLGWTPVGYVERDEYCQRILRQRITDGLIEEAPIYGDIKAFNREGYAAAYTDMVDVITAGFPCQPFSVAGKREGKDDDRNLWPATIECIRVVRPRYCLLENVPGLLAHDYFGTILGTLAESGYGVRYRILSAAEVGAPHQRDRLWIMAYAEVESIGSGLRENEAQDERRRRSGDGGGQDNMADTERDGRKRSGAFGATEGSPRLRGGAGRNEIEDLRAASVGWWAAEPKLGRVAHGVARRVDRLRAIGNGQVPAVAAAAWHILTEGVR